MTQPVVSLVCIADRPRMLPVLIACLRAQTFDAWELIVLDQANDGAIQGVVTAADDPRVQWIPVPNHHDWGQTEKVKAAQTIARGDVLGFPNDDAYYAPCYLARMVAMLDDATLDLVYCDWIFDKFNYLPMVVAPKTGHIDVGGFLVRRQTFMAIGWDDRGDTGDGIFVEHIVASGARHARIAACYYVKN